MKPYLIVVLAVAAATPALADLYSDTILADSPVAYWRLGGGQRQHGL